MKLKFKLAQINLFVGNFEYNLNKINGILKKADQDKTDIVIFPEMAITGYPPDDLLYKKRFIENNLDILKKISTHCTKCICIIGFVNFVDRGSKINNEGSGLYNSAAVIANKKIQYIYNKINLPNYNIFDEKRYFKPGKRIPVIDIKGIRFGLGICEDIWVDNSPVYDQAEHGRTDFIININASPYYINKRKERTSLLNKISSKTNNYIFYLNVVGAQDGIVFDGNSMVFNNKGEMILGAAQFKEDIIDIVLDFKAGKTFKSDPKKIDLIKISNFIPSQHSSEKNFDDPFFLPEKEEVYNALILGTKDYIIKNNFKKVILGLSGGIDSAMTAAIAVDAIGQSNVISLFMPSRYSSESSFRDAQKLSKNLKIELISLPIEKIYDTYLKEFKPFFKDKAFDSTEENIQARIRGNMLMAFSNKFGYLVLTTGNKSEMSTGYATLYGDMAGGYAVLKDVYKTLVYDLARYRNAKAGYDLIPDSIISKAPSAELKEDQKDTDSLPPYDTLDQILILYIEEHCSYKDIMALKRFNKNIVSKVINLVDKSEYKRRQSPPGIKITKCSLGRDRRMPITSGYILK
ncbi:MAG: NAD+ synthase [Spirochaetes bacterium]|nr:NAD+ synthase [Spirochaetota bacterium]